MPFTANKTNNSVGQNRFTLSGKILKKEVKFSGKGNQWGNVRLEVPSPDGKFKSQFTVKFFGDELSEKFDTNFNEGDNVLFYGYIKNGSYEKDGVKKYTTDFIANGFVEAIQGEVSEGKVFSDSSNDVPF